MGQQLTVLLAAEYQMLHAALALLIDLSDLEIVGEATDGEEVLAKVLAYQPDILLLDPLLWKKTDSELVLKLRALAPNTQLWVLAENWLTHHYWVILAATPVRYPSRKISAERLLRAIGTQVDGEA